MVVRKDSILEKIGLRSIKELVGFDIGTRSIKVCLLERKKKGFNLKRLAKKEASFELLNEGIIIDEDLLAEEIKRITKEEDIRCHDAACALSSYVTIMKKVSIPEIEGCGLEEALKTEVEAQIPIPIDEIFYSFHVIGSDQEKEGFLKVLLVAAKREVVEAYSSVFSKAGLRLRILDVDIIDVVNLVEEIYSPSSYVLAADIGSSFTRIAIMKGSDLELTREIAIGGKYLTNQIEKTLKIGFEEAERMKISADPEISYLFEDFVFNVVSEISKTVNFFRSVRTSESIERIFLTGGSSLVPGLMERLKEETGLDVTIVNPFLLLGEEYKPDKSIDEFTVFMPIAMQLSSRVREFA